MAELDALRSKVLGRSANIIQRKVRSYLARKSFIVLKRSAIQIQALCRRQLAREIYDKMHRQDASLRIQTYFRMYHSKKAYRALLYASITIQSGLRGMAARKELLFRRRTSAAIIIQRYTRGYLARLHYMRTRKAAITTQCAWRGRLARKELRQLKLVDMEEAKSQENAKLQVSLEDMQQQVKDTRAMLMKEKEATKRAAEEAAIVREVPVVDTAAMDQITAENNKLKEMVSSLEKKIDETEKKYEETSRISEERLKKAKDAELMISDLNDSMQRLADKLSNMEAENQVLRQQTLLQSPVMRMSEHLSIPTIPSTPKQSVANGHHDVEEPKEQQSAPPAMKDYANSDPKLRRSFVERQHESVDALINCVVQNIGFSQGKPVAAFIIYRCLLHWKSFESEKTNVFDRLIQMVGSAIENEESNEHLSYWLSNTSTLLMLLQKSLKASGSSGVVQNRKPPPPPTSLFGRMTKGFRSSPSSVNLAVDGLDVVRQVEAKYPALLFKQQLTAYVEKIYGIIRDNMKKDMTSLLSLCIQAPRTAKASMLRGTNRSFGSSTQSSHWQSIIDSLNTLLKTLQENYVPEIFIRKIFTQIFSFINVQLFNSLLLRRECCSFSNGEYVKSGLAELELWCAKAKQEYAGSSWDELKHIRQAVGFLVIFQKYRISYDEIVNDLCPVLSVQQLYRICTQYWDDKYNTQSVSSSVLSSMRILMTEDSNSAVSGAFLLDDNSGIPFSIDDISSSLQDKDFSDVKPPEELLENQAFQFLQE